jgi:arginase family enzyme
VNTKVVFFPFDLFGSSGTSAGVELLADAFREMLSDNRHEKIPTRAASYQYQVKHREFTFETLKDYENWRVRANQAVRQAFARDEFLIWITGNHLGALPVYDVLSGLEDTLVVQFDAHLDVYNLIDCTTELSHGNFLLHCDGALPRIINLGTRELLLRPDYVRKYYHGVHTNSALALDPAPAIQSFKRECAKAKRVWIDLDCDVFDPAYFPALSQPLPFGLSPWLLLRLLDAAWSDRVIGLSLSEFDPARDVRDISLSTLVWLLEYLLLKRHERSRDEDWR